MMRLNTEEEGIHICVIVDFVACDDVDICLGLDFDKSDQFLVFTRRSFRRKTRQWKEVIP